MNGFETLLQAKARKDKIGIIKGLRELGMPFVIARAVAERLWRRWG